jgi:hypothetical protein
MNEHRDVFVFQARNKHSTDAGRPPQIDANIRKRYHGYFENEHGEQAIFVYDYEVKEGTLWMGDAGWEKAFKVIDARVPELVLSRNEALWLYNCWITATGKIPD